MKTKLDEDFGTRLLLLLLTKGLLSGEQLASVQANGGDLPEKFILEKGWVTRDQMAEATASSYGLDAVAGDFQPMRDALPQELMEKHQVVPVEKRGEALLVAVAAPTPSKVTSALSKAYGGPIHFIITDRLTLAEKLIPEPAHPAEPEAQPAALATTEPPTATVSAPEVVEEDPLIGGRYKIGERFMDGRFSILYKGRDERAGLPVAIRHLESYFTSEDARTQTLREGRTLAKLRHPNLPRIRHLVSHKSDIYLVADEISGRTLAQAVEEDGAFDPELVRRYLKQLLQVVDFLHSQPQPIIHRDLRPTSILVTQHGNIRLAEFGLAKMGEAAAGKAATSFRSAGDPDFAAPEQLLGDASSVKNDLYSVGALAYYMALGKPPAPSLKRFSGGTLMSPLPAETDHKVIEVVKMCLEPRPEDRCESASALLAMLESSEVRLPMLFLAPEPAPTTLVDPDPFGEEDGGTQELSPFVPDDGVYSAQKVPEPARSAEASQAEPASSKRSMWQLLFGRKKKAEVSDAGLGTSYHEQLDSFAFADLSAMDLDRQSCRVLPEALCRNIGGICIGRLSDTDITIACKDPTDIYIYDQIALVGGGKFNATLMRGQPDMIDHAMEYVYKGDHLGSETTWTKFLDQKRLNDMAIETTNEQAVITFGDEALEGPVVQAVDRLIKEAIAAEASDIHLEPFDTGMNIRYRIDGVLRIVSHHMKTEAGPIVKRLKVLANMDIAQERVTQGGRISLKVGTQEFDLRVSIVPVPAGESVVMRILKKGAFTLTLSDLGFAEETETRFRKILSQPHGMILVCGPTGSGKSTTLYASLKEIARPDRKLLTAEDPIEYQMPGIIQVQMNTAPKEEEKRVTFSKALREFLRQDPDVILVGEIRDQETAEIGIQAALTGHLLLSTLHTNDSIGIISRLRDMDCEPFQIGSVLLGGLAQRLARKICQQCREPIEIPSEFLPLFASRGVENPQAFRGRGCRNCHQSGHRGRLGVYELLEVSPEVRSLINRSAHEEEIKKVATEQGFRDLLADGLNKVKAGLISLEEVLRVCKTI
jgi:type II secretory ATPase GspE/PulE/Tfp pilus assembly ATPase PilB-like protein/serine/threonine protein kinase